MHFPTSLPPASGSPAAKLVFERGGSPHPESFDGPLPPPGPARSGLPLRRRSAAPSVARLAGPRFPPPTYPPPVPPRPAARRGRPRFSMPSTSADSGVIPSGEMPASLTTAKLKMDGRGLPSERLIAARNSWKRKRTARLDGARKPNLAGSIGNLDGPFHTEFENAKEDAERSLSLMSVSSQKLKKIFRLGQDPQGIERLRLERTQSIPPTVSQGLAPLDQLERSRSSGVRNDSNSSERAQRKMTLTSPRKRLTAARASRQEDKEDFSGNLNPGDSNNRLLGDRGHRMSDQMKKLKPSELKERHDTRQDRRASEKDAHLFQVQTAPEKTQGERHRFAESARRKIHMAKEELEAFRSSIADDVHDSKESSGKRIANAVRTAKARLENRDAERQAGIIMTPGVSRPVEQSRYSLSSPRGPIFSSPSYDNSTSSSSQSLGSQTSPGVEGNSPPSPRILPNTSPHSIPAVPIPRNRAYQQVFPARPSASYRPTLSPVYSKSPIPTNSLSPVTSTSQKTPNATAGGHIPISADPVNGMAQASIILNPKPPFGSSEARGQDPTRRPPPTTKRDQSLQSTNETANLKRKKSYEHPMISLVVENDIPPLKLPSPEVKPTNSEERPRPNPTNARSPPRETITNSAPQSIGIDSPRSSDPRGIREFRHLNTEFLKTPTSSALGFWAAADASLAPSESASAQPPNRTGEPPPDIWKDADRTSSLRKGKPTLEEWIADLPGLGLQQGSLAANSSLDTQILKELRTKSIKESSSNQGNDIMMTALAEKLKVLEDEELELSEEFVPEDETGLTSEELKALEETEPVPENAPPLIIDPFLLHPDYHPNPSPSVILEAISPVRESETEETHPSTKLWSSRLPGVPANERYGPLDSPPPRKLQRPRDLVGDASTRLDTLEKYWNDQGIIVGTVLRRMLWIVDTIIVKEREEAQRLARKHEMGWTDDEDDRRMASSERT